MSKKCKAYSKSKLGLEPPDNRKAFYAGWEAALAAEQPKHPGYVIGSHWLETAYSRICAGEAEADVLRDIGLVREEAFLTGVAHLKAENEALRRDAEQPRHPGYIIGNHWFETAYSRVCAGEAEDAILEDYELVREPRLRDLRRDAERYRWLRDKAPPDIGDMASVRDSHDPSEIDAAIDAAMEEKR